MNPLWFPMCSVHTWCLGSCPYAENSNRWETCLPWFDLDFPQTNEPTCEDIIFSMLQDPQNFLNDGDFIAVSSPYLVGTYWVIEEPLFAQLYTLTLLEDFAEVVWNINANEHILHDFIYQQKVVRRFCKKVLGNEASRNLPGSKINDLDAYYPLLKASFTLVNQILTRPSKDYLKVVDAETELWISLLKMLTWMNNLTWLWEHPVLLFGEIIKEKKLINFANTTSSKGMTISKLRRKWQSENRRLLLLDDSLPRNPFDYKDSPTTYRVIQLALELEKKYEGGNFRKDFYYPVIKNRMKLTRILLSHPFNRFFKGKIQGQRK